MPLFFYISGYLTYSMNYSFQLVAKRSINRLCHQLYPTLLVWGIYLSTFYLPPWDNMSLTKYDIILLPDKGGYWFTIVIAEIFFLSLPLLYYFSKFKLSKIRQCAVLLISFLFILIINIILVQHSEEKACHILYGITSFWRIRIYIAFFFLGMVSKMFNDQFSKIVRSLWIIPIGIISFIILSDMPNFSPLKDFGWRFILCGLSGVITVLGIFNQLAIINWRPVQYAINKLSYLGKSTLEIYLLHYFLINIAVMLFDFSIVAPYINTIWELPIFLGISIVIASIVMLFVEMLKYFNLYRFIFPNLEDLPSRVTQIWSAT